MPRGTEQSGRAEPPESASFLELRGTFERLQCLRERAVSGGRSRQTFVRKGGIAPFAHSGNIFSMTRTLTPVLIK
mgnify:CR=1 FL=1